MKIVTYKQAEKLYNIGFREYTSSAYFAIKAVGMANEIPFGTRLKGTFQAPTVYEALNWIRENKGIEWDVRSDENVTARIGYSFRIYDRGYDHLKHFEDRIFPTHPEAEAALLTEILDYINR